ncbi:MAG: acetyl-coenzyme A synthetase N-terminal domain-containing protein, partial [Nitrososphaera sp.]
MSDLPSKLYEESGKVRIGISPGRRLERVSKEALTDPDSFWAEQARSLKWIREWKHVLEW